MNRKLVFAVLSIVCLAGMLVSVTLSIGVSDQPAYMVVRGSDNGIYYRLFNEASGTWGAWTNLPGSTCDSPSAAYIGDQLCVVVRGMDGSSMWQGFVNVNTDAFSGWTPISGSTPSAVELGSASTPSTGFESTGYISIPGAGLHSERNDDDVGFLPYYAYSYDTGAVHILATVQFPDGVTITNMTVYWNDENSVVDLNCYLGRTDTGGGAVASIADGKSNGDGGLGSTFDTAASYWATVDNSQYSYLLNVYFPIGSDYDLKFLFATIGFEYPT
jgi:hypothetical protein